MRHLVMILLAGCVGDIGGSLGDDEGSGSNEQEPVVCEQVRSYKGFAGTPLETGRLEIDPGSDRIRMKPFVALATEYERALGVAEVNTTSAAATFGRAPARWYVEPQASANTVYAAFALAYSACTQKTTSADFAEAPNANNAQRLCRDFAAAAWHREPTADEITTCATFATDKTNAADAPAKRWAYTCAAVLTASGFLTY